MNSLQNFLNRIFGQCDIKLLLEQGIIFLFILAGAFLINFIGNLIFVNLFRRVALKTKNNWDDLLVERKLINKLVNLLPAIFMYVLLPLAFPIEEHPKILAFLQIICKIYIISLSLRFVNTLIIFAYDLYTRHKTFQNKPIKGLVQLLQVGVFFVGFILIISALINKSPITLFAGLGASAAILMLVFKDTILGFVAGIQLSANDMLRPGDWITVPKYGADGTVTEVSLNAVKVQNFDNTISMIPPYSLVSDSFQNWRGMSESPGRRIKRSVSIDMHSVRFCDQQMLDKFKKISLLRDYIHNKEEELMEYNKEQNIDESILVNGRRQTNLGVFRIYLEAYLRNLPSVNKELICMVRQLQPTPNGIPVELYFFSSIKDWVLYEGIQSDVFDHVLAIIPEFELKVFQSISGGDLK